MQSLENDIPLSPRLKLLWNQSYVEEGYDLENIPDTDNKKVISLYPRSFVTEINKLDSTKTYDFNFRGAIYIDNKTYLNRHWIFDFANQHFTLDSYFHATDKRARKSKFLPAKKAHTLIGQYDYTFRKRGFVPKEVSVGKRAFFDREYFELMAKSKFTLCPAGDALWSMRFYEAIMSKSLPILERKEHTGRNSLEYQIGYKFLLKEEKPEYREEWVEDNYIKFLKFQTLFDKCL
ncbi:MAG: exostosin family protein [Bacteroidales bacterium]|nr:exostosin family protein [Bacteroidales bacterium]